MSLVPGVESGGGGGGGGPVPANFRNVVMDMTTDLSTTFPEHAWLWQRWTNAAQLPDEEVSELFLHCSQQYPDRFFDILYQNESLFTKAEEENKKSTFFLPGVDFRALYTAPNVTATTRLAIWKYLQLMLFTVVGTIQDKSLFDSDTTRMFANIDETAFNAKLNDTIASLGEFFSNLSDRTEGDGGAGGGGEGREEEEGDWQFMNPVDESGECASSSSGPGPEVDIGSGNSGDGDSGESGGGESGSGKPRAVPTFEDMYRHLHGLFDGKIGKLAQELAEDISQDIHNLFDTSEFEKATNSADLLKQMMKDPAKIKELVQIVSEKLNAKLRSGEITQDELMQELGEFLEKMKSAAGAAGAGGDGDGNPMDFQSMFKDILANLGGKIPKRYQYQHDPHQQQQLVEKGQKRESMNSRLREKIMLKRTRAAAEELARRTAQEQREREFVPYDFPDETSTSTSTSTPTPPTPTPTPTPPNSNSNKKKKKKNAKK